MRNTGLTMKVKISDTDAVKNKLLQLKKKPTNQITENEIGRIINFNLDFEKKLLEYFEKKEKEEELRKQSKKPKHA
jgi:hypothetical protein